MSWSMLHSCYSLVRWILWFIFFNSMDNNVELSSLLLQFFISAEFLTSIAVSAQFCTTWITDLLIFHSSAGCLGGHRGTHIFHLWHRHILYGTRIHAHYRSIQLGFSRPLFQSLHNGYSLCLYKSTYSVFLLLGFVLLSQFISFCGWLDEIPLIFIRCLLPTAAMTVCSELFSQKIQLNKLLV